MALYAFDGTWNVNNENDLKDTNVVKFKELYSGNNVEYIEGVGTRFGVAGKFFGGAFGAGGHMRIDEMYEELCQNFEMGDETIDIIGFSRGAALAVHFANKIGEEGVKLPGNQTIHPKIRFLGLWDIVGSFGLAINVIINFQEINLGWNIDTVHECVDHCFHAMALDERRETFNVTRLDPGNRYRKISELWFRGVHSDVGGGNGNILRSNIALQWMVQKAIDCQLPINRTKATSEFYHRQERCAPISENFDIQIDPRREIFNHDQYHNTALGLLLDVGESHECEVVAKTKYNWSGLRVQKGFSYTFSVAPNDTWEDAGITCGPGGWRSQDLPWFKEDVIEIFEKFRRLEAANWFALVGALGDEEAHLFPIGDDTTPYTATRDAELYLFANDMDSKYDNNHGSLTVTITRVD